MKQTDQIFRSSLWSRIRLAHGILPVVTMLERHGVAVDSLLEQARIARFGLMDPAYTISIDQELSFLRSAIRKLPHPAMSLEMARQYHLRGFSVLGLAMQASAHPLAMLQLIMRFPRLAWGLFDSSLHLHGVQASMQLSAQPRLGAQEGFLAERDLACAAVLFEEATGRRFACRQVSFRHACRGEESAYQDFFACPVHFSAARTEILVDLVELSRPMPQSDPVMCAFFTAQCERMSQDMNRAFSYAQAVRERLQASAVIPDLHELARRMLLTPRTLQRRLSAEQLRFSDLLREVREERARELLRETSQSMEQIATSLGFSDAVAFSHAFKDWTGHSPKRWRQQCALPASIGGRPAG